MQSWKAFEAAAPDYANAAHRLFVGSDGAAIGFLATASPDGTPHIAPVCPIFAGDDLYLSAVTHTPKVRDLRDNPSFALHSFLGPDDEEVQLIGLASEVTAETERNAVHDAIQFGSFDKTHPVFRLSIRAALWVYWENAGKPDTRAVRKRWGPSASAI